MSGRGTGDRCILMYNAGELCDMRVIRELLSRHGLRLSKSLGQNFLTAAWVPERIAESAGLDEGTGVVEIGPGLGCLTVELAKRAGRVVAVELDRRLMAVHGETLGGYGNVAAIYADALKLDLDALVIGELAGLRPVVCANLPYNITTPVLTRLLEPGLFSELTVMVQSEVAERITARPGTAEYGAFTVYASYHASAEVLFSVPPDCFYPRPKVRSSVVRLTARPDRGAGAEDERTYFRVVRAAFGQRRKTLLNALTAGFGELSRPALEGAILEAGIAPGIRGEVLSPAEFAVLSNVIYKLC